MMTKFDVEVAVIQRAFIEGSPKARVDYLCFEEAIFTLPLAHLRECILKATYRYPCDGRIARKLYTTGGRVRWCQGARARDQRGEEVAPQDASADAWSVMGAIEVCYPVEERAAVIRRLVAAIGTRAVAGWESETDFPDILKLLRKAGI
jgi:hypothetical protein